MRIRQNTKRANIFLTVVRVTYTIHFPFFFGKVFVFRKIFSFLGERTGMWMKVFSIILLKNRALLISLIKRICIFCKFFFQEGSALKFLLNHDSFNCVDEKCPICRVLRKINCFSLSLQIFCVIFLLFVLKIKEISSSFFVNLQFLFKYPSLMSEKVKMNR